MRLAFGMLATVAVGACSVDARKLDSVDQTQRRDAGGATTERGAGNLDASVPAVTRPGQDEVPTAEGIQPPETVSDGAASASCASDGGSCVPTGDAGSACVATGPRDCASVLDNDCDGRPDNTLDDVCLCAPDSIEPCEDHPGLDGRGQCQAGSRACILGEGNLTSDWGACEGSVGPGDQDSCSVLGDDANCDGTDNGGCPCIEGETQPCGPDTDDGICELGTQTCVNATFGPCVGAVFAAARNCASSQDNDCNGAADNGVDNACTCVIGSVQACGAHPGLDGNGRCRAGSQTCEGRASNATSTFGTCTGSVGPALQDTCAEGDDSNCNGVPNEGCGCINGRTRGCGPDTELGLCQRGVQTCGNGTFGQCLGAVFPAPRNCDSAQDNDCDGRPDDTFDNVCLAPQNPFSCASASPPATVLPFNLLALGPEGGPIFPAGQPPAATGGTVQNGRYSPALVEVYGQANAPAFAVNELTFEFSDGFVQVGYQGFVGTGAVLGSGELAFVGSAASVGTSLLFDVDACGAAAENCSAFGTITCSVPNSLSYSATASSLVTFQPANDGSTVVISYTRQ